MCHFAQSLNPFVHKICNSLRSFERWAHAKQGGGYKNEETRKPWDGILREVLEGFGFAMSHSIVDCIKKISKHNGMEP